MLKSCDRFEFKLKSMTMYPNQLDSLRKMFVNITMQLQHITLFRQRLQRILPKIDLPWSVHRHKSSISEQDYNSISFHYNE